MNLLSNIITHGEDKKNSIAAASYRHIPLSVELRKRMYLENQQQLYHIPKEKDGVLL